jgi:hypothetical protein
MQRAFSVLSNNVKRIRFEEDQHPLQILGILRSSSFACSLTSARVAERRNLGFANRVRFIFAVRCTANVREAAGADTVGAGTELVAGGGIAGTLAALPTPLGSLTEPLSPRAFAGPGAMPLTPASWAGDLDGAARRARTATIRNTTLPINHPRGQIEASCACLINR